MKYLFSILFIAVLQLGNTQDTLRITNFNYSDSVFSVGQKTIINVKFRMDHGQMIDNEGKETLDTLKEFLIKNPNLTLEVSSHSGSRGHENYNKELTKRKSKNIVDYLVYLGINTKRLTNYGAGETELIYSDEYIEKNAKNIEEKEQFHFLNIRTEIKITSINFKE